MSSDPSLKDLLCVLLDSGVPLVVVGGYAARMHGSSLLTQDIDVCALITPETIARLREILAPLHPVHRMTPQKLSFLQFPESTQGVNNIYLGTDLGQVDLLGLVSGVGDFARVQENAVEVQIFGRKCKVISIDDLIAAKKFMGRPRDHEAVRQLEWIQERIKKK